MTSEAAWRIFEQTGNIEAYLLYQQLKTEEADSARPPQTEGVPPTETVTG